MKVFSKEKWIKDARENLGYTEEKIKEHCEVWVNQIDGKEVIESECRIFCSCR